MLCRVGDDQVSAVIALRRLTRIIPIRARPTPLIVNQSRRSPYNPTPMARPKIGVKKLKAFARLSSTFRRIMHHSKYTSAVPNTLSRNRLNTNRVDQLIYVGCAVAKAIIAKGILPRRSYQPLGKGRCKTRAGIYGTTPARTARSFANVRCGGSESPRTMSGKQTAHKNITRII